MKAEIVHRLNEFLHSDQMCLLYSGDFSDNVTAQVIGLSGVQFDDGSEMNKLQRKTGFLIAECFQNIVRHNESSIENGYFLLRNDRGDLHIASGNIIQNKDIDTLSGKLDHLNSLTKEELKKVYLDTLSNNTMSAKGGAGLGLIEMARKTGNELEYGFSDVNEKLSYFYFQLKFGTNKGGPVSKSEQHRLPASIKVREYMLDHHLFLVYKGDVSMDTVLPLLGMIEKSIASISSETYLQKKVLLVMIEFLQNMSKHGALKGQNKEGLLVIGEKEGKILVGGSNYIQSSNVSNLQEKLSLYASMSIAELNEAYKNILKKGDPENKIGSSLGLIEMARRSSAPFEFEFEPSDDDLVKFNLLLQI